MPFVRTHLSLIPIAVLALSSAACQSASPAATPSSPRTSTGVAVVYRSGTNLYGDDELAALRRFHTSPSTDIYLAAGVHVDTLGESATAPVNYGLPDDPSLVFFEHVRVADGPARGTEGWVNWVALRQPDSDKLPPLSLPSPRGAKGA